MADYRVLIVDDTREVRRALVSAIETLDANIEIRDVPSGEEGLLELSSGPFDLLVSDVRLPGISGLELLTKIRIRQPELHVILVTGMVDAHVRQAVADAGATAFFLKPIETADFLDAVERALGLIDAVIIEPNIPDDDLEKPVESVAERLTSLRKDLNAISAVMLDERSRVLARAGDLPDASIETALFPALMTAFSASNRISKLLNTKPPRDILFFAGVKYDIFLAHVGESYALLVAANPGTSSDQMAEAIRLVHSGLQDLLAILSKMGVRLTSSKQPTRQEVEPEPPFADDVEVAPEMAALFEEVASSEIEQDANVFWDTASTDVSRDGLTNADSLSYDEARRLGLTPEEDAEQ
ncbi:MAG: response regulator [Anaerolineae bacterium]|nr:response regulator [Anaerolineae bacterium]